VTEERDGRTVIVLGESTWGGRSLESLQAEIDDLGISAFLAECQHDVTILEGGIFGLVTFRHCEPRDVPELEDIQVWVDPAVTDTDKSDAHGVQADGRGTDGKLYRLFSWEQRASPEQALRIAILKARELNASCVGVETDQGGDTWASTFELTWRKMIEEGVIPEDEPVIPFKQEKAGSIGPKSMRATQMLSSYERGEIVHVINGTNETLERALRRYLLRKPYDLVDAAFWSFRGLLQRYGGNPVMN
jgi:phage terminase large subunit-like protein